MITKTVIKDYVARKCPYLVFLELKEKTLVDLLKKSIDNQNKYRELIEEEKSEFNFESDGDDGLNVREVLKDYPELRRQIEGYQRSLQKNSVEELIFQYDDNQLVSNLSRRYFELKYGTDCCVRCDVDKNDDDILEQFKIVANTQKYLLDNKVKVIFEGQVEVDEYRARFDVLIKNADGSCDIIEAKGTNNVFEHPTKNKQTDYDHDSRIKDKYLYDLLFQYYVYSKSGLNIRDLGYMFTNREFKLRKMSFPVDDSELDDLFIIRKDINLASGTVSLKQYFDDHTYVFGTKGKVPQKEKESIEEIIDAINKIALQTNIKPCKHYLCKKTPSCEFMGMCFDDADDPNSILKLTGWSWVGGSPDITKDLIDNFKIERISQISPNPYSRFKRNEDPSNAYLQVEYQKGSIKEKYVINRDIIEEIIKQDYLNNEIDYLIFFDFESFMYPVPLVSDSNPWKQVVSQYSMHIVKKGYDLSKHDFTKGDGGDIRHYEYIGNPDTDKYVNPSIELYKTLKRQLEDFGINPYANNYRVVVFNQGFEKPRMKEFVEEFSTICDKELISFINNFNENVVDLLKFFTRGALYCKEYNGRASLKVVQPSLTNDADVLAYYKKILKFDLKESLEYHNNLVYNGAICLDLYKSLLIRSHLNKENIGVPTNELLKQALAYCKIDSWGTVIIYDIIKNVYLRKITLDVKEE